MSIKVKIALSLISLFIVGLLVGMYYYNKKVPGLENAEADYTLTANELFNEFDTDEAAANKKYLNKVIAVSGEVISVNSEKENSTLSLKADNAMIGGINCSFRTALDQVEKNRTITVKGRCQGFLMEVILNNCVIDEN